MKKASEESINGGPSTAIANGPLLQENARDAAQEQKTYYKHKPLAMEPGSKQIRLIKLYPNCCCATVHFQTKESSLAVNAICFSCAKNRVRENIKSCLCKPCRRGDVKYLNKRVYYDGLEDFQTLDSTTHLAISESKIPFAGPWKTPSRLLMQLVCLECWNRLLDAAELRDAHVINSSRCKAPRCVQKRSESCCNIPQLDLEEVSLDSHPEYEAVSYAWGSTELAREVKCGSDIMVVTESCFQVLRELQPRCIRNWIPMNGRYEIFNSPGSCNAQPRTLWIDGICIDQTSLIERSHQVDLMADVYMTAVTVVLWPGPEGFPSDELRNALQFSSYWRGNDNVFRKYQEFLERPYFYRIWPVQELALSRKGSVIAGGSELDLAFLFQPRSVPGDEIPDGFVYTQKIPLLRCMWSHFRSLRSICQEDDMRPIATISRILLDARKLISSEPRDKIFALQGMLSLMGVHLDPPDYAKRVETVYTNATIAAIIHDQNLDILSGVTGHRRYDALPSWSPDWSDNNHIEEVADRAKERASASSVACHDLSFGDSILQLRGAIFDTIEHTVCTFSELDILSDAETLGHQLNTPLDKHHLCKQNYTALLYNLCFESWNSGTSKYPSLKGVVDRIMSNAVLTEVAPLLAKDMVRVRDALTKRLDRKTLFKTRHGRLGLASKYVQVGDDIVLLAGCNLPMVIRPDGDKWRMAAPAFIHGDNIMKGGLWKDDMDLQEFIFV